jgi:hypothetical protein
VTAAGPAAPDVVMTVDHGPRRRIKVSEPRGEQHVREFPVPSLEARGYSPLRVDVLHTDGTTVGDPAERWHVKLYLCPSPETAAELELVLRHQAELVHAANAAYTTAHPDEVCPWAVAPFWITVHGDVGEAATGTRYDATPEEIRAHPSATIASWFGNGEAIQPERCLLVASPFLDEAGWHRVHGLAIDELAYFTSMARALDVLHRTGVGHCDVKPSNVRRIDRGFARRYVLVDGDSVVGLYSAPGRHGLRHTTLPPAVRRALDEGRQLAAEELAEIDRFGFVLLVLAALAGEESTRQFLDRPESADIRAFLLSRSSRHPEVADVVAGALEPGELTAPGWTAEGWLARLYEAATGRAPAVGAEHREVEWSHHADVAALRRRVQAPGPLTSHDDVGDLLGAMAAQAAEAQARARAQLLWSVRVVCLVLAVIAVIWAWQVS